MGASFPKIAPSMGDLDPHLTHGSFGQPKFSTQTANGQGQHFQNIFQLECGPMPNVMVALPNTGGALCSTPQSLADAQY